MPRMSFPLGLGSYESLSLPFSAQRCINLYAVLPSSQALSDAALFGTPGVLTFGAAGTGVSRGATIVNGVYYVVTGTTLYEVSELGVATSRGTIAGEKRVSMANNGEKLVIVVPGGVTYQFNTTPNTLVNVTGTANFQTSDTVVYKDGYFIFTASDGKQFFISNLSVGSSTNLVFDALDFATAELNPDKIVAVHVNHDELFVQGEVTTEVFQNIGGSGFPFQRIPGASFEKGSHCKYGTIQWEGSFYFIGGGINERSVIWQAGTTAEPRKVSTDAIDNEVQMFTRDEIAEAFAFTYSIGGHAFVGFTIRSVNIPSKTFVLNTTATNQAGRAVWFEKQTGIDDNAWRANSVTNVYDKLLISDSIDGRIGYLDQKTYEEYGEVIARIKTTAPLAAEGKAFFVSELELVVESGVGLLTGQGSNPIVNMIFSEDGSKTWSSESRRSLGAVGEYLYRTVWRRQGRTSENRVFKFRVTDPVKVVFIKLELEVQVG